ncbi:ribbon-helix-helix protein, CopG family [Streptomyces armeniacus]|nr:ribbon-helix-helix protein, CopG family [Streptomyces armeniacus]
MTPKTISFRPDPATRRELDALAEMRDITASDAIRQAIHEVYVAEQYRRAAAEVAEWREDPEYQAEVAAVAEEMSELRAW